MQNEQTPAAGPLPAESVKLLQPGDLLRSLNGTIGTFLGSGRGKIAIDTRSGALGGLTITEAYDPASWTFLGRPDQDGWIAWHGGGNPVPGVMVCAKLRSGQYDRPDKPIPADQLNWKHGLKPSSAEVIAYRPHVASPASSSNEDEDQCGVCLTGFAPDDACATDVDLGTCHAACLEGSPIVDIETGEEKPGATPFTYRYDSLPQPIAASSSSVVQGDESGVERDVQGLVRPDAMAGRRWRHKARGTTYTSLGVGKAQCAPSGLLDDENVVIYQGDDGSLWARRHAEFSDGRFEEIAPDQPHAPVSRPAGEGVDLESGEARTKVVNIVERYVTGWSSEYADNPYEAAPLLAGEILSLFRPQPTAGEGEREAVARIIKERVSGPHFTDPALYEAMDRDRLTAADDIISLLSPAAPDAGGEV